MADTVNRGDGRTLVYDLTEDIQSATQVQWVARRRPSGTALMTRQAAVQPGPAGVPSQVMVVLSPTDTDIELSGPLYCQIVATIDGKPATFPEDGYVTLRIEDDVTDEAPLLLDESALFDQLSITDPTGQQLRLIQAAIRTATQQVQSYIGAPLTPQTGMIVLADQWQDPAPALRPYLQARDLVYTANDDLTLNVTFTYGYDPGSDPLLRAALDRWLPYAALQDPQLIEMWRQNVGPTQSRRVRSASTDGQSVSYEQVGPNGEVLGSTRSGGGSATLPSLTDFDYWRVAGRRINQGDGYQSDPLPRDVAYFNGGGWY